jgi:hypothetical protein
MLPCGVVAKRVHKYAVGSNPAQAYENVVHFLFKIYLGLISREKIQDLPMYVYGNVSFHGNSGQKPLKASRGM